MITTAEPPRRGRPLEIALAVSLFVHLLGIVLWGGFARPLSELFEPKEKEEPVALSDVIRLEKRTVPREAERRVVVAEAPPAAATVPRPEVRPAPPRVAVRPQARPQVVLPRQLSVPRHEAPPEPPPAPAARVAAEAGQATTQEAPSAPNALSQAQLEALNSRFARTIAQSRIDPNAVPAPAETPAANKRYQFVMSGSMRDLRNWQGEYWEIAPPRFDRPSDSVWHYLHIHIAYPDGRSEDVDLPWPAIFPRGRDPIAVHAVLHAVPEPPAGYALPHPFNPSRVICIYFRTDCQALFDAEGAAGAGAP